MGILLREDADKNLGRLVLEEARTYDSDDVELSMLAPAKGMSPREAGELVGTGRGPSAGGRRVCPDNESLVGGGTVSKSKKPATTVASWPALH